MIVIVKFWVEVPPRASWTVTVTAFAPAAVGVPETTPVLAFSERPAGSAVEVKVYGAAPPEPVSCEFGYTRFTVQSGREPPPTGAVPNVRERMREALAPALSVTLIVTENVPDAVGVPESAPLPAFIDRPAGRPLAAHVYGRVPFAAASVVLYESDCSPLGNDAVVIDGGELMVKV